MKKYMTALLFGVLMANTQSLFCKTKEEIAQEKKQLEQDLKEAKDIIQRRLKGKDFSELDASTVQSYISSYPLSAIIFAERISPENLLTLSRKVDVLRTIFKALPAKELDAVTSKIVDILANHNDILLNVPNNFFGIMALSGGGPSLDSFENLARARERIEEDMKEEAKKKLEKKEPTWKDKFNEKVNGFLGKNGNGTKK